MNAKELRIGNIVDSDKKRHNEEFIIVESISSDVINSGFREYSTYYLKGVELTEEWLIKAGFEKTKDYYISTKPEMYKVFRLNLRVLANEYTFCYEGYFKKIEFVHQLQNLYFELTGSELDF